MKKLAIILFLLLCMPTMVLAEDLSIYPKWEEHKQLQGTTDGTTDSYTLTLAKDQRVTFTFEHIGDAKLQIWTADKEAITISIKDLEGDRSSHFVDLRAGTYKISIGHARYNNKVLDYSVSYKLSGVGSFDLEKNDTVDQANLIPFDTRIVGKLDGDFYKTADYYKIYIPKKSILTFQAEILFNSQVNANLVGFTLYDKDMQKIGYNQSTYRFNGSIKQFVDAGTYYIKVHFSNSNEPNVDYAFTVSAEPVDPTLFTETGKNVKESNAMKLPFDTLLHGFFYSDNQYSNTWDYYTIDVPKDGVIEIEMNRELVGGHLRFEDDHELEVQAGTYKEPKTILESVVTAGKYSLEAVPSIYFEGYSPYTLIVRMRSFTDVSFSHPYFEQIESIENREIINGYPDRTFRPKDAIKREHAFKMLAAIDEITFSKVRPVIEFSDVPKTNPYYNQIKLMYEAGIVSGDNGEMKPKSTLTRAQMAKILVNAFDLKMNGEANEFSDVSPSDWSYEYVQILASNGITTGSDGRFLPNSPVTREHFALFLARTLK